MTSGFVRKARNAWETTAQWLSAEWGGRIRGDVDIAALPGARPIVLLAWFFPPMVSGGTYRPLSFVKHGAALGWRFCVVGGVPSEPPGAAGERLLAQVPTGTEMVRVGEGRRYFFTVDGNFVTGLDMVTAVKTRLGATRPGAVLASGPPFNTFIAGRYLAHAYRVPLILDYRDEWTETPFFFVKPGRSDRWWERRCQSAADLVLFTTGSQRANALARFSGLDANKCIVVPNGWEPDDASGPVAGRGMMPEVPQATIAFVGHLAEHTPPDKFLDALENVLSRRPDLRKTVTLAIVGQKSASIRARLARFAHQDVLRLLEQVPKDRAAAIMRNARSLLILNDPKLARYLPGKIYEYLGARRPLLVYGEGGEVAALVRELDAGIVIPDGDDAGLEKALDRLTVVARPESANPVLDRWLERHTRAHIARELFSAMTARGLLRP